MIKIKSRLIQLFMAASVLLMVSGPAKADPNQARVWSGSGTALTTNLSYFVTSAAFSPARVEFLAVQSDSSAAQVRFWQPSQNSITVTQALTVGLSNILVQTTNGLAVGDVVVLRDRTNDQYQRCKVHLLLGAGSIVITNDLAGTATTSFALSVNDEVWRMKQVGTLPISSFAALQAVGIGATNSISAPGACGLFNSPEGRPGLVELGLSAGGSTNTTINLISGSFYRGR